MMNEDVLGNERADAAAKVALPAPSPHIAQWQAWRAHAEKFRLFWGTSGHTPLYGPEAAREIGEHPGSWLASAPSHQTCLVWPAGGPCEWPPQTGVLKKPGVSEPPR